MFDFLKKMFGSAQQRLLKKYWKLVASVNEYYTEFQHMSEEELCAKTEEFRRRLGAGEALDDLLPEAYAVVKSMCNLLCGEEVNVSGYEQEWDMVPYDVQILGAIAMHYGAISEMKTGEGKTLTATMPLYLNALTGDAVHLVTVNDYLAHRDGEWMGEIFRRLGLSVGALREGAMSDERKKTYLCDIVYGTASEFGFDYLRDNSLASNKEEQVQRGFSFAIVDEIDSILIDEARTPLIISGPVPVSRQMYDALRGGVSTIVKMQRDLCNRLATQSRKEMERLGAWNASEAFSGDDRSKMASLQNIGKDLWLVSKGTPRNKILKRVVENPDMREIIDNWDIYFHSDQNKEERGETLADLFIIIDEKGNEYELTDKGITAWEQCSGEEGGSNDFVMLDLGDEYRIVDEDKALTAEECHSKKMSLREEDSRRKERAHNLRQLFRGHLLMEKDVDYIIQEDKVVIIDENTGRPQPGRRFSDGLHQAIEAKEAVSIQKETQTYASVTLQNYFRMYEKLSGMTGTAMTEAHEFKEIYKLEVLEIPPHRICKREDANDEIYMTEREKYHAILREVREIHEKGRPILIGTESVEVSEKLSRVFKQNKLPHTVLNAKYHGREAEVIAEAGHKNAVTISTNMAGRGTDIKLKDGVEGFGGLHVLGTTRHHSRRIDRQLIGRCARQGDPGTSKFFVSFEDQLMRLFASPRITGILKRLRPPEGEPISAGILNKSIETAQKRLEQRNFMMRKHTLEYDDVMNKQRKEIYAFRNDILRSEDIVGIGKDVLEVVSAIMSEEYFMARGDDETWNHEGFSDWMQTNFPVVVEEGIFNDDYISMEEIEKTTAKKILGAFDEKCSIERGKASRLGVENHDMHIDDALRSIMVKKIDKLWQEHLLEMDYLRSEVRMRTVGQKDPLMEFKHEAFRLFHELSKALRLEIGYDLFRWEVYTPDTGLLNNFLDKIQLEKDRSLFEDLEGDVAAVEAKSKRQEDKPKAAPVVAEEMIGRNDPCPCGSGKKYKKCCGSNVLAGHED
jgi:preprotein translocase subunit SecA